MSETKLDPTHPDYNPFDPENMAGGISVGLDDRTGIVVDARAENSKFGAQMILSIQADGEDKAWAKYYDAGNKARANEAGTGFVDEHGIIFTPTKASEVGQFGTALFDAKIKNLGGIARDLTKLIGHRLHWKEVTVRYVNDGVSTDGKAYKKGDAKKRKFKYGPNHPKAGQEGFADKTIALPVSVVSYPGGVAAGASDAVEAKAKEYITKALSVAPNNSIARANASRDVSKVVNGDPDKAAILGKVLDQNFLKSCNSEGAFKYDGLTLSL